MLAVAAFHVECRHLFSDFWSNLRYCFSKRLDLLVTKCCRFRCYSGGQSVPLHVENSTSGITAESPLGKGLLDVEQSHKHSANLIRTFLDFVEKVHLHQRKMNDIVSLCNRTDLMKFTSIICESTFQPRSQINFGPQRVMLSIKHRQHASLLPASFMPHGIYEPILDLAVQDKNMPYPIQTSFE